MWFTIAVEEDSALGLQGTLDLLQELTGAESIRQLPTLKLFKIRMDLEMEARTPKALATAAEVVAPAPRREGALRRARRRRRPRDPGRPAGRARAVRARRRGARLDRAAAARAHGGDEGARAAAPRRRDPLPPPRRLQRERHGRLEGAGGPRSPSSARAWPPTAASATATSARPTPTGPTRSSRWPTAAPRRSATRSSTRSTSEIDGIEGRATLYSSTEFKKVRLQYFTDEFKDWEREHGGA